MDSKVDEVVDMYFNQKFKPVDIARKFNISRSAVTQILQKDERYKQEQKLRKEENKKKHIENTKEYIKHQRKLKQIKNNSDDLILQKLHKTASVELSGKRRISNVAYRNWNTSAYTFNTQKNQFEFRKELGRSYDVPKYIKFKR